MRAHGYVAHQADEHSRSCVQQDYAAARRELAIHSSHSQNSIAPRWDAANTATLERLTAQRLIRDPGMPPVGPGIARHVPSGVLGQLDAPFLVVLVEAARRLGATRLENGSQRRYLHPPLASAVEARHVGIQTCHGFPQALDLLTGVSSGEKYSTDVLRTNAHVVGELTGIRRVWR